MELRHLRYFVRLADELHFARAAEGLGISQPPLSQQIRQLEDELGVRLFERTSRRVALTEAGTLFLGEARATLERADHAVSTARRAATGEIGELAIGFSPSALLTRQVSAAIARYRRAYPEVHLDLGEQSIDGLRQGFAQRSINIGLIRCAHPPAMPPGVTPRALLTDRLYAAMPADHPLAGSDAPLAVAGLDGEPMVHYPHDRGGFLEDLHRLFADAGVQPTIVQETREMSTLLGLVSAGLGLTVISGTLRRLGMENLRYRPIADAGAASTLWLLARDAPRTTAARFVEILEDALADDRPD